MTEVAEKMTTSAESIAKGIPGCYGDAGDENDRNASQKDDESVH